jgi:hypothetical protein
MGLEGHAGRRVAAASEPCRAITSEAAQLRESLWNRDTLAGILRAEMA